MIVRNAWVSDLTSLKFTRNWVVIGSQGSCVSLLKSSFSLYKFFLKGKGGDEDEEPGWKMPESEFKTDAEKELEEYEGKWRRRNEQHNFQQRHDAEIIKEEKMIEVEDAVRLQERIY